MSANYNPAFREDSLISVMLDHNLTRPDNRSSSITPHRAYFYYTLILLAPARHCSLNEHSLLSQNGHFISGPHSLSSPPSIATYSSDSGDQVFFLTLAQNKLIHNTMQYHRASFRAWTNVHEP